jgi:pyruvate dehydrogenase E2 component (dihydrolipoamide acetyltransferase)
MKAAGATKPHASPSVRRFARELGVDLQRVSGTGRKGRIVKQDVQAFVQQALARPPSPATAATAGLALPEMPEIDYAKFGEITIQPLGRIKKLTATSLHRSWLHVPHVTHHDEADITELENFRKQAKEEATQRGVRLTMLAFIMKACVSTLKQYPSFNASLETGGENLILKQYYHLGIAVDTDEGLVVPVIRAVDQKGVLELAKELGEVSERARGKKLTPSDVQGGTFTISSLGGIGGTAFTPIVNAPEVAILGVSRAQMKPVFKDDDFIPRLMLPLSLSYDHRVIDGAEAARFTAFLTRVLEDARRLLL